MLHCDLKVRWKVASDLRFRAAISEPKTLSFCGISGDLAPSTRKSLAIAIVRFWFAKVHTGCRLAASARRRSVKPFKTSAKPKRDRGRDSQHRPRPRLNSQPQGATQLVCPLTCLLIKKFLENPVTSFNKEVRPSFLSRKNLEKAGNVDCRKHPARKVGTRSRQCRPKVPSRFGFPGAPNPRICSFSRFGKIFPAIFPGLSRSFPREPPNRPRKQPQPSRVFRPKQE